MLVELIGQTRNYHFIYAIGDVCCVLCINITIICRWAQTIGHENSRSVQASPTQSSIMSQGNSQYQSNKISSLLSSASDADSRIETRAILAHILLKELGENSAT